MEAPRKKISERHLVSLNTARIKMRKQHPRISKDLKELFEVLKYMLEVERQAGIYKEDGFIDIDE